MKITRRGIIRLATIAFAAVAALSARNYTLMKRADYAERAVTNNYARAVEELAASCENLSTVLEKQMYAGSGPMQQALAVELYRETGTAKAALSQLPVAELNLQNTYKFLSQAGNYSLSLSKKLMSGEKLTDEEYRNICSLYDFSKNLTKEMWQLEGEIAGGELSLTQAGSTVDTGEPPYVTEGFTDFEGSFDGYPKLIYDGPFSDNILERTPKMTENAPEVEEAYAKTRALSALRLGQNELSSTAEILGNMPGWRFSAEDGSAFCEVTKNGGFISYFLKMRSVDRRELENNAALEKAEGYLNYLGITDMEVTYFEVQNNIMTVNFCYMDEGKRVYPDLVKVSVAMDNGDILGYDARGFLVNHGPRQYADKLCTVAEARAAVSDKLKVKSQRLAVIPTDGLQEKLCYEFTCSADNGRNVLVYINAQTAAEEEILILLESRNGTLTQ